MPGLDPSTLYYFAMKTADAAEPANVSALSNVPSVTTRPPLVPVTVHNPWLVNDRVADTHNLDTMAATYVNEYTPDGVVVSTRDEQKAVAIYNNQKRRLYHWADEPPSVGGNDINDPTYNQNVFGWGLCGRHASQACTIAGAAGFGERKTNVPGDWQYEVNYDGRWHLFHTMMTFYVYTRDNPPHIASSDEIKADNTVCTQAEAEGRVCPGFLLCGDTATWEADACNHYSVAGTGQVTTRWTGNMDLRLGQTFKRTWEAWEDEHPNPRTNADSMAGLDPPYHHECQHDNEDYVNWPYWEPYGQRIPYVVDYKTTYRRWSNGTDTLAPDFRSAACQALLDSSSHDIATYDQDAITPDLHAAAVGVQGEAVFKVDVPFYITDATISGDFTRTGTNDGASVLVSDNGVTWTTVYTAGLGTTHVDNQSLRPNVFAHWQTYWIKIQVKATTALTDAGVSNFVLTTIFEHNKGAMAYLDKGVNHITVTFDNPAELAASGNVLHIVYKWKEYDGAGWTIDKQFETTTATSPTTFTITTGGDKVPRTEYILMDITQPDVMAPSSIADLAAPAGEIGRDSVVLNWTAPGDDGLSGQASRYDIRYSTDPIVDQASFDAATQVAGVPAPQPLGSSESFTVSGLQSSTTYYFAVIAYDDGNNSSGLSNVVSATTGADTPPAAVTDLMACHSCITRDSMLLNWTATGEDGTIGTATSYDLRYSTGAITDMASFNAATPIAGVSAPQPAGSTEAFTLSGLTAGTTYNFALVVYDAVGQASPLSNVAVATTLPPRKTGDVNDDGYVNVGDLQRVVSAWGSNDQGGWYNWDPDCDFDSSGSIDVGDLLILATHWNS